LRDDAIGQQDVAIAGFVVGGAALVAGVVLLVLAVRAGQAEDAAWLRPTPTGIALSW
jgi:hypothetical protein